MRRQNQLANSAYKAAVRVVHRSFPGSHLVSDLAWVRLTLPRVEWAYVIFASPDKLGKGWFALVHRVGRAWVDASAYKPYCSKLPERVREQLFLSKKTRGSFLPQTFPFLAPRGETRC
jgi:hypothetical protein